MRGGEVKKFKFIGCEIIYREGCYLAATGPHRVDVQFLPKGLHGLESPEMVSRIQEAIDAVDPREGYEAILMGYARCNDGLVGLTARDIPLVVPKAHDCITFFFGSRGAYREYFDAHPGTYYMTTGWSERSEAEQGELGELARPTRGTEGVMGKLGLTEPYEQLVAKYGKENADYIRETLGDWRKNYSTMLYFEMGICEERAFIDKARETAMQRRWEFKLRKGNWTLLEKLFFGEWDDDFLMVRPGRKIIARNDENILDTEDGGGVRSAS